MHCERIQSTVDHSSRDEILMKNDLTFNTDFIINHQFHRTILKKPKIKKSKKKNDVTNFKIFDIVRN